MGFIFIYFFSVISHPESNFSSVKGFLEWQGGFIYLFIYLFIYSLN